MRHKGAVPEFVGHFHRDLARFVQCVLQQLSIDRVVFLAADDAAVKEIVVGAAVVLHVGSLLPRQPFEELFRHANTFFVRSLLGFLFLLGFTNCCSSCCTVIAAFIATLNLVEI